MQHIIASTKTKHLLPIKLMLIPPTHVVAMGEKLASAYDFAMPRYNPQSVGSIRKCAIKIIEQVEIRLNEQYVPSKKNKMYAQ
jgi:hypothetical protein